MINQTLVIRINPTEMRDGENRHLRQAANRVCLESIRESGKSAVQKMEAL